MNPRFLSKGLQSQHKSPFSKPTKPPLLPTSADRCVVHIKFLWTWAIRDSHGSISAATGIMSVAKAASLSFVIAWLHALVFHFVCFQTVIKPFPLAYPPVRFIPPSPVAHHPPNPSFLSSKSPWHFLSSDLILKLFLDIIPVHNLCLSSPTYLRPFFQSFTLSPQTYPQKPSKTFILMLAVFSLSLTNTVVYTLSILLI